MKKKQRRSHPLPNKTTMKSKRPPLAKKKGQQLNKKKRKKKGKNGRRRQKKQHLAKMVVRDTLLALVGGLVLMTLFLSFFLSIVKVNGFGMMPALRDKEVVLVQKTKTFKRFDLIVFSRGDKLEIRRVIGLPGERIRYDKDTLLVNDEQITEKFIIDEINESQKNGKNFTEDFSSGGQVISKGIYLVLGDNRPYANDSRLYGYVQQDKILGVVKMRILPLGYI